MGERGVFIALRLRSGQLVAGSRQATQALKGVGAAARTIGSGLARAAGGALDRLATPGAILGGLGVGVAAKQFQDLDLRLTRIGVSAGASAAELAAYRDTLMDLAGAPTGGQTASDLIAAAEVMTANNVPLAEQLGLLQRIGITATATGAEMVDLAQTAFQLGNAYGLAGPEISRAMEQAAVAGKRGAFELADIAAHAPQVGAAMAAAGQRGAQGWVRTLAILQIVRRSTADAGTAANDVINLLGFIQSRQGATELGKAGVQVFDGGGRMRDIMAILDDIDRVTRGGKNQEMVASIFSDRQARDAIASLLKDGKDFRSLIQDLQGAGSIIDDDAARVMETTAQQVKILRANLEKLAATSLGPWVEKLGGLVQWLNEHPVVTNDLLAGAAGLAGLAIARRGLGAVGSVLGRRGGAVAGVAGAVLGGAARGGTPVFVTNWPGGVLGSAAGGVVGDVLGGAVGAGTKGLGARAALGAAVGGSTFLGANLAAGVGTVGAGALGGAAIAAGGAGYLAGTLINEHVLTDGIKTSIQNAFAQVASMMGSAGARNLLRETYGDPGTARREADAIADALRRRAGHVRVDVHAPSSHQVRVQQARDLKRG